MRRQRRKITFVAHAPQQKVKCAVATAAVGQGLVSRRQPLHQCVPQAGRAVVTLRRVARDGALHHGAQAVVGIGVLGQQQVFVLDPAQRGQRLALGQQRRAGQQLPQHQAGGKNIHLGRGRAPCRRLG